MKRNAGKVVAHRWGFYSGNQLAYGAIGHRGDSRELSVQVFETQWHVERFPLPVRIRFERQVRGVLQSDLIAAYGAESQITIRFVPKRVDEASVASACLGADKPLPA